MSEFKGTPGPWFVGSFGGVNGSGNFVGANPSRDGCHQICNMSYSKYIPDNEVDANGALIAAAPELLDALQDAEKALFAALDNAFGEELANGNRELIQARAAIAKALGESK